MADYYPLIAKAVAGLEKNTGDARRALYERARTALVTQLRGVVPALAESDITRERLALEESIRKVEAEAARKARLEAPPPRPAPRPEPQPSPAKLPVSTTAADLRRPTQAKSGSLSDEALRGFRAGVGDAEHSGGLVPHGKVSPKSDFDRLETHLRADSHRPPAEPPLAGRASVHPEPRIERPADHQPPPREPHPVPVAPRAPAIEVPPSEPEPATWEAEARDHSATEAAGSEQSGEPEQPALAPREAKRKKPPREHPPILRSYRRLGMMAAALLLLAGLGGLVAWQWQPLTDMVRGMTAASKPPAPAPREAAPSAKKITDRVGTDQRAPSAMPAVAQRVVLYEEDPSDPAGKRYVGSSVWRTETVSAGQGQPAEMVVRADIEIPERKMTMKWSLRRNADKALPASHTVEIMFTLPSDFANQGIQNIPGILMKQAEQTRGVPLAGLAVKVTTNFFLIGLSAVDNDMQRNIQILKERAWFDVPIVYNNGRRAILAVEKGTPGERAFADAFTAWKQ